MLELYQAEDCPFCEGVREKLMELGVSYVTHNPRTAGGTTRNKQTLEEMESIGGQDQIPFLLDRQYGVELYESDAIIEHLEAEYA